jgi:hypothetical protein
VEEVHIVYGVPIPIYGMFVVLDVDVRAMCGAWMDVWKSRAEGI